MGQEPPPHEISLSGSREVHSSSGTTRCGIGIRLRQHPRRGIRAPAGVGCVGQGAGARDASWRNARQASSAGAGATMGGVGRWVVAVAGAVGEARSSKRGGREQRKEKERGGKESEGKRNKNGLI
jgi:hypothetical protein